MSDQAVIAAYTRSAFTPANRGEFAATRPDEIAGQVVQGLLRQTDIDPSRIENLILGCAFPEGEQGMNLARMVAFLAGPGGAYITGQTLIVDGGLSL